MTHEPLNQLLPELVALVRRDGVVLDCIGGRSIPTLIPGRPPTGLRVESVWPEDLAALIRQLVRRVIAERSSTEAQHSSGQLTCRLRVTPQGPDRALCTFEPMSNVSNVGPAAEDHDTPQTGLDRRGFLRRLRDSLSSAVLRERPAAVAVIQVEGITDIAHVIADALSQQIIRDAIQRLAAQSTAGAAAEPSWYVGQLDRESLGLVLDSAEREVIYACLSRVCDCLRAPLTVGTARFHLSPYAGVAILGQDGTTAGMLVEHARAAAAEARRSASQDVHFFTDTLKLRSLARLDVACELQEAIERREIGFRYVGRYQLATGKLVSRVGYLRWIHPLRGEVRPAEFVALAEATGLAVTLSRYAMTRLTEDYEGVAGRGPKDVPISFGALRHHILSDAFVSDVACFLSGRVVPPELLELRISERAFIAVEGRTLSSLHDMGVRLVVDEVGRGLSSLDRMARSPLSGLQLDRSWASALHSDPAALKLCSAGISVAAALGLTPIATGVDDAHRRQCLLESGCQQGMGDFYAAAAQRSSAVGL